jgi:hypothetical protein
VGRIPIFGSEPVKREFFIVVLFNLLPPVENQAAVFTFIEGAYSGCTDGLANRSPSVTEVFEGEMNFNKFGAKRRATHTGLPSIRHKYPSPVLRTPSPHPMGRGSG